jgi:hypothetical protein
MPRHRITPCTPSARQTGDAMYSMMPHYAHLPPNFVVPVTLEKNLCPTGTTALVRQQNNASIQSQPIVSLVCPAFTLWNGKYDVNQLQYRIAPRLRNERLSCSRWRARPRSSSSAATRRFESQTRRPPSERQSCCGMRRWYEWRTCFHYALTHAGAVKNDSDGSLVYSHHFANGVITVLCLYFSVQRDQVQTALLQLEAPETVTEITPLQVEVAKVLMLHVSTAEP